MSNYTSLILDIQRSIKSLQEQDISIELIWIPGHADLKPNELADLAAKDAARQAAQWDNAQDNSTLSLSEVKKEIRLNSIRAWQRRWDRQEEARLTHEIIPRVNLSRYCPKLPRKAEVKINRLTSGHSMLEEHACRMGIPSCPTPLCACGKDTGSVEHFLLHCSLHTHYRYKMIASMNSSTRLKMSSTISGPLISTPSLVTIVIFLP